MATNRDILQTHYLIYTAHEVGENSQTHRASVKPLPCSYCYTVDFHHLRKRIMKKLFVLIMGLSMLTACNAQKTSGNQKSGGVQSIDTYRAAQTYPEGTAEATFAGGCFWCTEASFERIQGVIDVVSGYSGGEKEYPTYEAVSYGRTNHAEAIQVFYNPEEITYETLLDIFFTAHDPTQLNRQGPDVGKQYRSAIFYHNQTQKEQAEAFMTMLEKKGAYDKDIVTKLNAYDTFWVAEQYHQDYYINNPGNPYIQRVSKPKVKKVEEKFADLLKKEYRP